MNSSRNEECIADKEAFTFYKDLYKMISGKGLGSAIYFMFISNSADNKQGIIHEKYIDKFSQNNPSPKSLVIPLKKILYV